MTIHLLESLGFAALHAVQYIEQDAQVESLCRRLVAIQVLLLTGGIFYDRLAQPCHAQGAGILLNDVPVIPFLTDYFLPAFCACIYPNTIVQFLKK